MTPASESLTLAPEARRWASLLRRGSRPLSGGSLDSRAVLGLPTDRPIVMSGHQATLWHPGILAKLIAGDALARRTGARLAWLVVDQDRAQSLSIRYPQRSDDGRLRAGELRWPAPTNPQEPHPLITGALREALDALARHASEPSPARAIARATMDLAGSLLHEPPILVMATELHRIPAFGSLVDRMLADPERCVVAYNASVQAHPGAGVRPLIADVVQDRFELPLWRLMPAARGQEPVRRHVYAEDLPTIPRDQLAPKALLMTALVRTHLCDLFIHGTGGGTGLSSEPTSDDAHEGYDRVMEQWLAAWLGDAAANTLAPATLATATRLLPLEHDPIPSPAEVARACWRAHHARHSPRMLGDSVADVRRRELVALIAGSPRADRAHKRELYQSLHALLARYREQHGADLRAIAEAAARARARATDAPILADRTWPFALYPRPMLLALRGQIDAAFDA